MDLQGKLVVVTGGTSGIGRAAALMLAARGADVTVVGRDPGKGAEVEASLHQASGGAGTFLRADLSLVAETHRVVSELQAHLPRVDALIQSAGVIDFAPSTTSEGLSRMFVTNFLHKLVLAEGLTPLLQLGPGRMVLVAADIPDGVALDWDNFEGARVYAGLLALGRLQGASLAVAQRLSEQWQESGVEVLALHPGQVDTGIFRSFTGVRKLGAALMRPFQIDVQKPAALVSWLAFSPEARGLGGTLFRSPRTFAKRRRLARSRESVDRVMAGARVALEGL